MIGWHHLHNGHEFEQAPRVGEGQGTQDTVHPWVESLGGGHGNLLQYSCLEKSHEKRSLMGRRVRHDLKKLSTHAHCDSRRMEAARACLSHKTE